MAYSWSLLTSKSQIMADDKDSIFSNFYCEVKAIEKKDSVLTPKQQIERLLRKGSTYFNLNPFEVLQVDPDIAVEDARKQYRKLSILVHPDKNVEDKERAQQAFDILKKAIEALENPDSLLRCKEIIIEARARTEQAIQEKRKQLKKLNKTPIVEEDDPDKYSKALWIMTMKLFAEKERKRKFLEERDQDEKKRQRMEQEELEEKRKIEEEFQKNFEINFPGLRRLNSESFSGAPQRNKKENTNRLVD
uniref:J domain-containing protein n=1 Tax=Romanomermis culicivorax TaxID=13658 RepID=A0A915HZQ2_ROMCU